MVRQDWSRLPILPWHSTLSSALNRHIVSRFTAEEERQMSDCDATILVVETVFDRPAAPTTAVTMMIDDMVYKFKHILNRLYTFIL
jgi:hypothetical protein